jgi:mitochondrial fission protein ELM1
LTEGRSALEVVVLAPRPGVPPSAAPPVRIFLGTEPAQHRAERVFVWSIERRRDPSRRYEIHLMKSLAGFRATGWTTGFTNYRFAVPHFADLDGRAVYNDVDQIYLVDPAELFDQPLGEHALRAVSPDDLSVMVMDCARLARVWSLADAQRETKRRLVARAAAEHGLVGELDASWNVRDEDPKDGTARVFHYTVLHTQPWRPFPERFAYQENPWGEPWYELEREADRARFRVFTRAQPSAQFRERGLDADAPIEEVPDEDLPWMLDERLASAGDEAEIAVRCDARRTPDWWRDRVERVAAAWPRVAWRLVLKRERTPPRVARGGPRRDALPPRIWILTDDRPGNTTQSLGLAEALGLDFEVKPLRPALLSRLHNRLLGASTAGIDLGRSAPLVPPWPDLVIAAGRRTAPVARWIAAESRGGTRIVQLGRKGGDFADLFDLAITPSYCRLFAHPRRLETSLPLHRVTPERLRDAASEWRDRLGAAPAPRVVLLAGGTSGQYRIDPDTARRLGEDVTRLGERLGGSVLATTSRRLGGAATGALCEALASAAFVHRWSPEVGENPYLALLALADVVVVTADSESMLAEAVSLGKPVYVYPLPVRASFRWLSAFREWVVAKATSRPLGERRTVRPQRGLELLCARAVERGWVRPTRDLERLHDDLERRGVARRMTESAVPFEPARGPSDLEVAVARVRALLGLPGGEERASPGARGPGAVEPDAPTRLAARPAAEDADPSVGSAA